MDERPLSSLEEEESMTTGSELGEACEETYDEEADQQDSAWMDKHHPGATDAVLSCPACFTQICFVCQAHARYSGQFRALSVVHCLLTDEKFAFGKKNKSSPLEPVDDGAAAQADPSNVFRAVVCAECGTKVGVMDHENVYHLFHVLAAT